MIKRKEFPHTEDYPASLPPPPRLRAFPRLGALLTLTALAFVAFWLGVRLHVPRLIAPRPAPGPDVTAQVFTMGRGCSLLLSGSPGRAVLIDTGTSLTEERNLKSALQRAGVGALSGVILTSCSAQSIGGLPRLLNAVPVRGPILVPVPLDQFQARGGHSAELCMKEIAHRGLRAWPCQDYLEEHPGLLNAGTSLSSRVIADVPASADVVRFQDGRSTLVDLGNLTPAEDQSALALRGALACDTLVIPSGEENHPSHEMLALSAAQTLIVPWSPDGPPAAQVLTDLAASDAHVLIVNQSEPTLFGLSAHRDDVQPLVWRRP